MDSHSLLVILSVFPAMRQHIDAHYFRQQLPASWLSLLLLVVHIYRQAYVSLAYHTCVLFFAVNLVRLCAYNLLAKWSDSL